MRKGLANGNKSGFSALTGVKKPLIELGQETKK